MKVYRYMSMKEFEKMSAGCTMENKSTFSMCRTESEGFCFLPEKIEFNTSDEEGFFSSHESIRPEKAISFLSGIVTNDVLVEFETESKNLTKSFGIYADPMCDDDRTICITEYCTVAYSRETMIPTRYAMVDERSRKTKWYKYN